MILRKRRCGHCDAGDIIPEMVMWSKEIASVDEICHNRGIKRLLYVKSGGDRCAVTGGTKVISDRITIK